MNSIDKYEVWAESAQAPSNDNEVSLLSDEEIFNDYLASLDALSSMGDESARIDLGDSAEAQTMAVALRRAIEVKLRSRGLGDKVIAETLGIPKYLVGDDIQELKDRGYDDLGLRKERSTPEELAEFRALVKMLASHDKNQRGLGETQIADEICNIRGVTLMPDERQKLVYNVRNALTILRRLHPELKQPSSGIEQTIRELLDVEPQITASQIRDKLIGLGHPNPNMATIYSVQYYRRHNVTRSKKT